MGDDRELLRLHLDRHNENHLILDQEIDRLVNEINHEIDHGEIVEDILEYQENNEANENDGFYKGNLPADIIKDLSALNSKSTDSVTSPTNEIKILKIEHKLHQVDHDNDSSKHKSFEDFLDTFSKLSPLTQTTPTDYHNMMNLVNFQASCSKYGDKDNEPSCNKSSEYNLTCCHGMTDLIDFSEDNTINGESICNGGESEINCSSEAFHIIRDGDTFTSMTNLFENQSSYDVGQVDLEYSLFGNDPELPGCSFGVGQFACDNEEEIESVLLLADYFQKDDQKRLSPECPKPESEVQEEVVPPAPPFVGPLEEPQWGAFGDGPGVHSVSSSTSSGNSSGSLSDDPQIEPLDLFWVSSAGSVSNNSTPVHIHGNRRQPHDESSSTASDTNTNSRLASGSLRLRGRETVRSSQVDLGISSTQSDASGNVADNEIDSESD